MSPSLFDRITDFGDLSSLFSARAIAALQALLVTFLWSTSYVLVKVGLTEIPALTFAGLRYGLAWCCLLPLAFRGETRREMAAISRRGWGLLAVLGVVYYAVTQGAQFIALQYLPAVTVSLFLNFTPVLVAAGGIVLLSERPAGIHWVGIVLSVVGAIVYFFPLALPGGQALGLAVMGIGVLANAGSSVLGRHVNRGDSFSPLAVTIGSMGIGSAILLAVGLATQGLPPLSLQAWAIVAWLAVVNTAFAFTLWNHTLGTLSAMESSVINNTMLVQIAVLGWVFLNETLTLVEGLGLLVAGIGAFVVQVRGS